MKVNSVAQQIDARATQLYANKPSRHIFEPGHDPHAMFKDSTYLVGDDFKISENIEVGFVSEGDVFSLTHYSLKFLNDWQQKKI